MHRCVCVYIYIVVSTHIDTCLGMYGVEESNSMPISATVFFEAGFSAKHCVFAWISRTVGVRSFHFNGISFVCPEL